MSDDSIDSVYKYTIPLDASGGVATPTYTPPSTGDKVSLQYHANEVVAIRTEAAPHLHKESVHAEAEEVDVDNLNVDVADMKTEASAEGSE
jgi:hypothetical protein